MRSSIFRAVCFTAIAGSSLIARAQDFYVVVGAFASDKGASEIKSYRPDQIVDTSYTISDDNKLMHFYVLKITGKEDADPKNGTLREAVESFNGKAAISRNAETSRELPAAGNASGLLIEGSSASASSSNASGAHTPPKAVGKYFKFNIQTPEGQPLAAKVHEFDFEKGRAVASYNSDAFIDLLRPARGGKPIAVVCGLFGYKEIYKYIDYANPSRTDKEAYLDANGVWVIPYNLERVEAGDVSPMHNVSFYKDAAIMRKSSTRDLDELVKMMHMNPYYEITIHAHCNKRKKGEIIAPGGKNYFDAEGSYKLVGTAKDLTTLRAETIKEYLSDQGVEPERIRIFSWGSSDRLIRSEGPEADLNDRIEIEFTRD